MNIQIKNPIFIAFIFTLYFTKSFGQTTTKEMTDEFFATYHKDAAKAVEYGFSTNKWDPENRKRFQV